MLILVTRIFLEMEGQRVYNVRQQKNSPEIASQARKSLSKLL